MQKKKKKKKTEKNDLVTQLNEYIDETHSLQFYEDYLRVDTNVYHDKSLSFYVAYQPGSNHNSTFTLNQCFFGIVSVTKNGFNNPEKYTYSGHGFCFNSKNYKHGGYNFAYNLIIFGAESKDKKKIYNRFRQKPC